MGSSAYSRREDWLSLMRAWMSVSMGMLSLWAAMRRSLSVLMTFVRDSNSRETYLRILWMIRHRSFSSVPDTDTDTKYDMRSSPMAGSNISSCI